MTKIIDITSVSDKVLAQGIIILVISVYAPHCSLGDNQKYDFYNSLVNVVRKLGEKEIVIIAGKSNLMFTLEVAQKIVRTSMKVMDME